MHMSVILQVAEACCHSEAAKCTAGTGPDPADCALEALCCCAPCSGYGRNGIFPCSHYTVAARQTEHTK